MGFLVKSSYSDYYEVCPTEGGHSEYSPRNDEDMEFLNFAKKFIAESKNVENLRAKAEIYRVSVERVGAGPAVPMIYKFLEGKHKDLVNVFDKEGINFDEVNSKMIIERGMKDKDPLCLKVIEKFTQIFAVEAANFALKTLPFGGMYLIGGVTEGIREYMINDPTFQENFFRKGRLEGTMRKIPLLIVNPGIEVGILGAEEVSYRLALSLKTA